MFEFFSSVKTTPHCMFIKLSPAVPCGIIVHSRGEIDALQQMNYKQLEELAVIDVKAKK